MIGKGRRFLGNTKFEPNKLQEAKDEMKMQWTLMKREMIAIGKASKETEI